MAIDTSNGFKPGNPTPGRTGNTSAATGRGEAAPRQSESDNTATKDSVVLSQQAQTLSRLREAVDGAPDVDNAKVAEIKQAITDGRFEINPERLAQAMLAQDDLIG